MEEIANRNPAIRKAISIEEIIKRDSNERRLYLFQEKARMERESSLKGAEVRGMEKGATEKQKEIVRNMLKLNLNITTIQQTTGLSQGEIKQLIGS